ncbi:MAG: secondary thiamine-phosphate synthase enzyme YjbQ [Methanobacteriaceae archaeon]|nr:secondary thiamine-phosphate synthase enzyme YjbQ [Methanobacteriaceae archaeon]
MLTLIKQIKINTTNHIEIHNITNKIQEIINENNIINGLVNIHTLHTTTSIAINEPNLIKDYKKLLTKLVPETQEYEHNKIDGNATSHLKSLLIQTNQTIPIQDKKMLIGTWQDILFIELDGPRTERTIIITIVT